MQNDGWHIFIYLFVLGGGGLRCPSWIHVFWGDGDGDPSSGLGRHEMFSCKKKTARY